MKHCLILGFLFVSLSSQVRSIVSGLLDIAFRYIHTRKKNKFSFFYEMYLYNNNKLNQGAEQQRTDYHLPHKRKPDRGRALNALGLDWHGQVKRFYLAPCAGLIAPGQEFHRLVRDKSHTRRQCRLCHSNCITIRRCSLLVESPNPTAPARKCCTKYELHGVLGLKEERYEDAPAATSLYLQV